MIVLTLTNCPQKLRGDLTKWLLEINTGVYVGNVSARVREALWERVCENIHEGQATMVFSTNNEQHLDFYVHNSSWKPVNLDGIKLMKHPHSITEQTLQSGFSTAARQRIGKRRQRKREMKNSFVMIDIETTGLSEEKDEILELGALLIEDGVCIKEYDQLILTECNIPGYIAELTGIDNGCMETDGVSITEALPEFLEMLKGKLVVGYNIDFDFAFLEKACEKGGMRFPEVEKLDVLKLVKMKLTGLSSYKLSEVSKQLNIEAEQQHRALSDCKLLFHVYQKLNEM